MADKITSETIFNLQDRVAPLDIIALPGTEELGEKINAHLQEWACNSGREQGSFLIPVECPRFSSGDGKGIIKASIRGDDLFILVDVGNYSCTYNMFGRENSMSPDDHFQDLKRIIQAAGGKAHRINVIMPILYGGRQHRRSYRESLDCAVSLQELERMGVSNIITFDAHDARVQNAVPLMGFDNVIPAYQTLKALFHHYPDLIPDREHLMIVSPDEGAMHRNMYYASIMGLDLGMFYKRRDYARVVNGRNPIVAHEYMGESVEGKDVLIVDDILATGDSMLDIAHELKRRKCGRVFMATTFAMFTNGIEVFKKAHAEGLFDYILATNLSYVRPEVKEQEWFIEVDMSKYIALIIATLNHDRSISPLLNPMTRIQKLLTRHRANQMANEQK